jgi:kynurenine 3-monooxygenase
MGPKSPLGVSRRILMSSDSSPRLAIVGAGLAGSLLACMLGRKGHAIDLYERRSDPRAAGYVGGRSINLAISARGIHALAQIGLADEVLKAAVRMPGRMIHSPTGDLVFQSYSATGREAIHSVSRSRLNMILLNAAAAIPGVTLHFDHRCAGLNPDAPELEFHHESRNQIVRTAPDVVISTDGAYSAIRTSMQKMERFDYSQSYLAHGYKELHIPPRADGSWAMEPNALHIWPRGGFMMIALPNQDGSFTCTCFWPREGENSFAALSTDDDVRRYFERVFPDAVPLMPTLAEDFRSNPVGAMVTIKCFPWRHRGKVALVGDAAHAIVPFYGQGANCAFEDCVALVDCMQASRGDFNQAFASYESLRKRNADAIADLALQNFIEMRDHTASRLFRAKKKFEHLLHRLFPSWYVPLYDMISFSTIPYADARERARHQWLVVGWGIATLGAAIVLAMLLAMQ